MSFFTILFLALALAMDAFAVSIAIGVSLQKVYLRQRFRLAWHFGMFQATMSAIGWYSGKIIRYFIEQIDHWLAAILLTFVGLHIVKEFYVKRYDRPSLADSTRGLSLLIFSVSTSIDALVVGISLSMLQISIIQPVLVIGLVALIGTLIGLEIGAKFSQNAGMSRYAQLVGGLVLIGIGVKILHSHNVFSF